MINNPIRRALRSLQRKTPLLGFFLLISLSSSSVRASDSSTFSPWLHSAAGISMPSSILGLQTQPASFSATDGLRIGAQSEADVIGGDADYRGLVMLGLDWFGAAASGEMLRDEQVVGRYGASAAIAPIGLSLGFAMESGVRNSDATDSRVGLLFRPVSHFQMGATAVGLRDKVDEYGFGLAMELLRGAALVVDATSTPEFKETDVKAGIKLATNYAGITASLGTADSRQITKGFSGGAFVRVGRLSTVELYYRPGPEFAKYLLSASVGF